MSRVKFFPVRFQGHVAEGETIQPTHAKSIDKIGGLEVVLFFRGSTEYFREGDGRTTEITHEHAMAIMRRGMGSFTMGYVEGDLELHGEEAPEVRDKPRYYWGITVDRCDFSAQETDA